jgi:hypothetical protein
MKFRRPLGLVLLFGTMLTGCGGGSGSSTNASAPQSTSVTLSDHLTLTLNVDKTRSSVGGVVTTQIVLSNRTSAPITSAYQGYLNDIYAYPTGGVLVTNSAGAVIGTDGAIMPAFPLPLSTPITVTLQPNQTLPVSVPYTFVRADTYTILAMVTQTLGAAEQTGSLKVTVR